MAGKLSLYFQWQFFGILIDRGTGETERPDPLPMTGLLVTNLSSDFWPSAPPPSRHNITAKKKFKKRLKHGW